MVVVVGEVMPPQLMALRLMVLLAVLLARLTRALVVQGEREEQGYSKRVLLVVPE